MQKTKLQYPLSERVYKPLGNCPNCGTEFLSEIVVGELSPDPRRDDFAVCGRCAAVLRRNTQAGLLECVKEEVVDLLQDKEHVGRIKYAHSLVKERYRRLEVHSLVCLTSLFVVAACIIGEPYLEFLRIIKWIAFAVIAGMTIVEGERIKKEHRRRNGGL